MLRIGLTGGSGSGKGYVSEMLSEYGCCCLDTDKLVHSLYKNDERLIADLSSFFGNRIVTGDGQINRPVLREIVFGERTKLDLLNRVVHNRVIEYCVSWMDQKEREGCLAAVIDAPQLFEAKMEGCFDYIIAVVCPINIRVKRIVKRDGITEDDALRRIANQLSDEEYEKKSDFVIHNYDGLCREQLCAIFKDLGLTDVERGADDEE